MILSTSCWSIRGAAKACLLEAGKDLDWLQDTHTGPLPARILSAMVYGNEDDPDHVDVYDIREPKIATWPLLSFDRDPPEPVEGKVAPEPITGVG